MKKLKLFFVFLSFITLPLSGCNEGIKDKIDPTDDKRYEIYKLALEDGYEGTYEEWLEYIRGKDGVDGHSPVVEIGEDGYWYIDGVNTGVKAQGEKGEDGKDGTNGQDGADGQDGKDGKDGISIASIKKTSSEDNVDTYTITYSDGSTSTFTITNGIDGIQGTQGIQGNPGADGHSPIITIGDNGNWFIDGVDTNISARGIDGEQGPQGEKGYSVLTGNGSPNDNIGVDGDSYIDLESWDYYLKNNNTWVLKGNVRGSDGVNGIDGTNGKSVYELYLEMHPDYQGSLEEWMDDLVNGRLATKKTKYYQVSFDSNGGTPVEPITVEEYKVVPKPGDPSKDGYTFAGWYINGEQWNFAGCIVTSDITLVAKWTGAYTLCFDVGEAEPMSSIEIDNSGVINELNYPVRYGYSFNGWYFHDQLVKFPFKYDGDSTKITFKAKWIRSIGDYDYSLLSDNEIALTKYNGKEAYIDIPLEINGKKVTKIGSNLLTANKYVESIRIHKNINKISAGFMGDSLKTIIIDEENPIYDSRDNCNAVIETDTNTLIAGAGLAYIPESVNTLASWSFDNSCIENIHIPAGIKIEDSAFVNCLKLKNVTIDSGISSIPNSIFNHCPSLQEFNIPDSVTKIGEYAFTNCDSLTSIYIPDNVNVISRFTFSSCDNLTSVRLPDSISVIPYSAFDNCVSLETINVPSNLSYIDKFAFNGCRSLENFGLPSTISFIGESAFRGCNSLNDITLPDDFPITELGNIFPHAEDFKILVTGQSENYQLVDNVVYDKELKNLIFCPNLENLNHLDVEEGTKQICQKAFADNNHLESIDVPYSVEQIGPYAFSTMESLTSITGCMNIKKIDYNAFSGCINLASVPNMNLIEEMGSNCFDNCQSLQSFSLSNHIEIVPASTFKNCISLESIVIPDSVKLVGASSFESCSSLRSVTLGSGVEEFGAFAFRYSGIESISFGENVKSSGYSAFSDCLSLTTVTFIEGIEKIDEYSFMRCPITELVIPDSVTIIDNYAFSELYGEATLETVTLGSGVTKIGHNAFEECRKLKSINLPEGLKEIGSNAFNNCTSFSKITIPSTVISIGNNSFNSCINISQVINKSSLDITYGSSNYGGVAMYSYEVISDESQARVNTDENGFVTYLDDNDDLWLMKYIGDSEIINIPEGVTKIAGNALWGSLNAKKVIIPSTVTYVEDNRIEIGKSAFEIINKSNVKITSMTLYIHHGDDDNRFSTENGFVLYHVGPNNDYLLSYEGNEENVVVPNTVSRIEDYCFANNSNIETVTLPDTVTEIGEYAFQNCQSLEYISIPDGITKISSSAFENCSISFNEWNNGYYLGNNTNPYLVLFDINENATELEINNGCRIAFIDEIDKCGITSLVLPDSVVSVIYNKQSGYSHLQSITFGAGLVNISSFIPTKHLVEIINNSSMDILPDNLTSGWYNGSYLRFVKYVITDGSESKINVDKKGFVTYIDDEDNVVLFDYLGNKSDIVIPDYIDIIGDYAFDGQEFIKSVIIPKGIIRIGKCAFSGTNIVSIDIPNSVTYIDDEAFNCPIQSIVIPDSVIYLGKNVFSFTCKEIYIPKNIKYVASIYLNDGGAIYCYYSREEWQSVIMGSVNADVYFYNNDYENQVSGDWHINNLNGEIIIYRP